VGYADDLYEYDFKGNFKIIKTQKGEPIAAHRMCLDKQGKLYVATFNQGLMVIKNQTIIKRLGKYNLLKSNEIRKVFNYKDTIWVGTTQEIGYLLNDNQSFVDVLGNNSIGRITYQDFIPSEQALLIAVGFKVLYLPRNILKNPQTLTVLYPKINQKENNIQIVLEMLNYTNPEYSRFYYRLENIDQKWQNTDDIIAFLRYSQLSPGDYVLEYYAEDKFSKLRSKLYKLNFKVKAAWWQQLWFYALIVCLIILFLTFIFYLWLKKAQKRQSLREQLWISQLKAIKAQMNPHFLYNILNTVQGLVYSNRRSEAAELLGKFSDLMRNTLESSEIPYLPLQDEINTIHLYLNLEQSRFEGKDFEYSVQAEEVWHLLDQEVPSMLIQPFVENAIKHGLLHKKEEKRLFIKFETHLNNLHISIEDNGIGRQHASEIRQRQAQRVQHFTMNATQQRIDLLNKMGKFKIHFEVIDLFDNQQVSAGTRVEINIIFLTPNKL
jgi:signal transduction histidine kinase